MYVICGYRNPGVARGLITEVSRCSKGQVRPSVTVDGMGQFAQSISP